MGGGNHIECLMVNNFYDFISCSLIHQPMTIAIELSTVSTAILQSSSGQQNTNTYTRQFLNSPFTVGVAQPAFLSLLLVGVPRILMSVKKSMIDFPTVYSKLY